jgi:diguanylate cyclase (GGDEF)-like protein
MQNDIHTIHHKRLFQLLTLASAAILFAFTQAVLNRWVFDAWVYFGCLVGFLVVYQLIRLKRQLFASYLFLVLILIMSFCLQWSFGGALDISVLAYPAILAFAAMIGVIKVFNYLLMIIVINLLFMGYVFEQGFPFQTPSNGMLNAITISVIIAVVAFAIRIVTRDNVSLLNELNRQFKDVQAAKDEVEHQATHDILTGLPNRLLAEERFEHMMARINRHKGRQACLMFIDLDEFKDINDTLGHGVGDKFLIHKARQLTSNLRTEDSVCRIGGDEFLILAEDLDTDQVTLLADKVLKVIRSEVDIAGNLLQCTSSIGIVVLPDDASDYEQAVQRADIAMYRSKMDGKNKFYFYDANMEENVQRRFQLQNQLLTALVDEELYVVLQPIHDVTTREMIGAEALARWEHKTLGNISPVEFIPIAENSGLISELSSLVLDKSCEQLKTIQKSHPNFYISVNISPSQLQQPTLFEDLKRIMQKHDTRPHQIKLEITESEMIERSDVLEKNLQDLREFGIGLYLDDFGTGYSNLVHLQEMKFESIKIDRSFIHQCHIDQNAQVLLSSIKAMAEKLNVTVVAEGIEVEQELVEVHELGIQKGQGYYWSKPLPAKEFLGKFISKPTIDS